jgi:23S rRNA (uracil1939-C5)-methyltransferase
VKRVGERATLVMALLRQRLEVGGQESAQRRERRGVAADGLQARCVVQQRRRGSWRHVRVRRSVLPWARRTCRARRIRPQPERRDSARERFDADRLQQRIAVARRGQFRARRRVEVRACRDRRRIDTPSSQRRKQLGATGTGHAAVEQQQVEARHTRNSQDRATVAHGRRLAAKLAQRAIEKVQTDRIVVRDEHPKAGCLCAPWHARNYNAGGRVAGRAGIMPGPPQVPRTHVPCMTTLEADITGLTHDGRGVTHIAGKAVFVAGALAGERVRLRYAGKHRHYDEAVVEEILHASPDRVEPRCAHFGVCGGCALQHLDPAAQIAAKQRVLLDNFERIGKLQPQNVLPPLTDSPWGYRRKGRLSVKYVDKKGRVLVGFRETNGRYVADIKHCDVLDPAVGGRIEAITALIESLDAKREIPQIEIAAGDDLVALVFRHLQPLSEADTQALTAFAQANGLGVFLQPGGIDSVVPLWPADAALSFRLPAYDVELEFRPLDFIQVNRGMNRRMIDHAIALLAPQPTDRVLDLFCGLGNFTLPLARRAAHVTGVEGDAGLVRRAGENARRNRIDNAAFFSADLAADQRAAPWAKGDYELLLLDPPRSGADAILEYLPKRSAQRVVYVSCHPASLARDAAILVERHGYKLRSAGVMDMFPHTAHVESIALFER